LIPSRIRERLKASLGQSRPAIKEAEAPADRRLFGIWRIGVCLTEVITDVAQAGEQSPARDN
jgi:hypothetical protein